MKRLFNERDHFTPAATLLESKLCDVLTPLIKAWATDGYSTRDIEHLIVGVVGSICSEERLSVEMDKRKSEHRYIVRLYDAGERGWIDIGAAGSLSEVKQIWNERTLNGTKNTHYRDGDYFEIFRADTKMIFDLHDRDPNSNDD